MSGKSSQTYMCLEFASTGVKMVQLGLVGDHFRLNEAKFIPVMGLDPPREQTLIQWTKALSDVFESQGSPDPTVLLSMNCIHVCYSQFVIPQLPKKEISETLKWKMKDLISFPIEEAVLDFRFLERVVDEEKSLVSVAAAAIPQSFLDKQIQIVTSKSIAVEHATQCIFSIDHLPHTFTGSRDSVVAVLDVGDTVTEIAFYQSGHLRLLRRIAFGGRNLTQVMMQSLMTDSGSYALSAEEAEQAKRQERLLVENNDQLIAGKIQGSKLYALVRPQMEKFLSELDRSIQFYANEHDHVVEQIFLTGGSSKLQGLCELIQNKFEIQTKRIQMTSDITVATPLEKEDLNPYYRLIATTVDYHFGRHHDEWYMKAKKWGERVSANLNPIQVLSLCFALVVLLSVLLVVRYNSLNEATTRIQRQVVNLQYGFDSAKDLMNVERSIKLGNNVATLLLSKEPQWREVFTELLHVRTEQICLESGRYDNGVLFVEGEILDEDSSSTLTTFLNDMEGPIFTNVRLMNSEREGNVHKFTLRTELA